MLRMSRTILGWIGIALVGTGCLQAARQESSSPASLSASPQRALLNRYCVTCHNEKLRTAGLSLDKMDVDKISENAPVWEKVVRKLRASAMPPAGMPRPDLATYNSFAAYLEATLDRAAAAKPNPGRPAIRRFNRAEYTNAIRDLLAVDTDAVDIRSRLPADDSGYGFDNIGDVLSVSPMLLERYMSAARKISRLAIGDPAVRPDMATYNVSKLLRQEDRVSEELPFGSRGGIAVRHFFPVDGEYLIKVRLKRSYDGETILGLAEAHQLDLRLDDARIKLFRVGGVRMTRRPTDALDGEAPAAAPPTNAAPANVRSRPDRDADAGLEVRVQVKAGTRRVGVTFPKETLATEGGVFQPRLEARTTESEGGWYNEPLAVGSVTIGGPYDVKGPGETPSRRKIFICSPTRPAEEDSCAGKILFAVARRAYRRSIAEGEIPTLLTPYKAARSKGGSFEAGIEMALQRILVSPDFIFRVERDPENVAPETAYRLSDPELASRLSFFLWSSIPDDELLDLAAQGRLKDPAVLERQVRRMLADSRSRALVDNFAGQWLYLRNIRSVSPDLGEFPDFDENLREALQKETELFFASMLQEDHSVLDLLRADYTFLNERLARHYGIPNIYGNHFRRVTLSDNKERRGLLAQGSILTATSYANRTAPTLRGKWILDNILGTPPPPPPPNVPSLKETDKNGKPLAMSMRQRMEQHRANPACAVCHKLMDPLGFALENFDAVGQWRTREGSTPVDPSGMLPDGTKFQGPAELQKVLLARPEQFVTTVTEKFLTYALGRGVEYYDIPAIRAIVREAASSDYRWSALVLSIVKSTPFQMRRSAGPPTTASLH